MPSVQSPPPPRAPRRPPPKRPAPRPKVPWIVILSGILCAVFLYVGWILNHPVIDIGASDGKWLQFKGSVGKKVILVMGVDAPGNDPRGQNTANAFEGTRSDTMMLVRVDSQNKKVAIVSIPRDSKVYIAENHGIDKINAAHAIGGPDLAVRTVQDSFGIPIDNFMVINFRGVRELVDAVGGIDVYVDHPMKYDDYTAKLHVNFQPGKHHLNGVEAESFLRFRHDALSDIGRIRRQQQFIVAVTNKLKEPGIVTRIPDLVKIASKYVDTDMAWGEMMALAWFGKDVNMKDVRTATLPGRPGGIRVSYWIIEPNSSQLILDRLILNNPQPADEIGSTAERPEVTVGIYYDPRLKDQIEGIETLINQNGFKVSCKSAQSKNSTQIVEHTGRTSDALTEKLRSLDSHMQGARLIFAPVGTTYESNACSAAEDYTVILGGDSI